jgi:hypothetical protein
MGFGGLYERVSPIDGRAPACKVDVQSLSITTNQKAIRALFRVVNRYVDNLAPMSGLFPGDYPAPVIRNTHGA